MKHQLSRDGQMLGEFTLDELREGRASGTFNGWEFVWIESTSQWQAIDEFIKLQSRLPRTTPPPIPLSPAARQRRILIGVLVSVGVLFVAGLVVVGFGM